MSESATTDAGAAQTRPKQGFPRRAYDQWRRGAHAIGVVQTRFIMLTLYLLAVVPTGLLMKLRSDPLQLRRPENTNCRPARHEEHDLDHARRQF